MSGEKRETRFRVLEGKHQPGRAIKKKGQPTQIRRRLKGGIQMPFLKKMWGRGRRENKWVGLIPRSKEL